jgi:hypothetical protein
MLARTPRNLGQIEDFIDLWGVAPDAFTVDALDLANYTFNATDLLPADFSVPALTPADIGIVDMATTYDQFAQTFPMDEVPTIDGTPLPMPDNQFPVDTSGDSSLSVPGGNMDPFPGIDAVDPQSVYPQETAPTSSGTSFDISKLLDPAVKIIAAGASIFATVSGAQTAAQRANAVLAPGTTRYVTRVDPLTGKAQVYDTLTGQPVTIDPATGLPVTGGLLDTLTTFVKGNIPMLALVGAALALFSLTRSEPDRRRLVRSRVERIRRSRRK